MLKGLAWTVSAILAVLIGSITVLLLSDRAFFAVIDRLLPAITPYRVTLEDPRMHWREGRLEIGTLQVHQAGSDGAPLLGVDGLSVSGEPRELLQRGISRADISAEAVLVYVNATDASEDPNPAEWLQYSALFPRKLSIGTLHVVAQDTAVNVFPFRNLYGGWQDSSHFVASAGSDYTGMPLVFALSVERRALGADSSSLAIHGVLKPQEGSSRIELDGELTATDETVSYRFELHAEYERVQDFLNAIEEGAYPFAGTLTLDGTLAGDLTQYDLDVRELALDNGDAYQFTAAGTVTKAQGETARLDVDARGRMASVDLLLDLPDINTAQIGEASAELTLSGPLTAPVLEAFSVRTRSRDGLSLSLSPAAGTFNLQQRELLPGQALSVALSAPTLAAIEPWVGTLPIEPGAWTLQLFLSQADDAFRLGDLSLQLGDLSLQLGDSAAFKGSLNGSIDSLRLQDEGMPDLAGIDLSLQWQSDTVESLLQALAPDLEGVPSLQRAQASGRLRGSATDLSLEDARLAITGDNLVAEAEDLSATLNPLAETPLQRVEGTVTLSLASTAPLAGLELPEQVALMDSLQIDSRVVYQRGILALSELAASAQALDGSLRLRGSVADALALEGLALDASLQGMPLARIAAVAQGEPHHPVTESLPGLLSGSVRLTGSRASLAMNDLDLALIGGESAGATLQGKARLIDGVPTAQIEAAYRLDDRELIEALVGQALAPGSGTVVLDYQPGRIVLVLHSLMGDSDISAVLNATRSEGEITRLDVDLNVPRLYLPDLLRAPESATLRGEGVQGTEDSGETADPLLAWRDALPGYPLRVEANIGEIVGDTTALEGFTFRVAGADRRFTLEQFDIDYAGGSAAFRGIADLAGESLGISIAGSAESLPITAVAADLGYAGDIEGELSVLAGITAQGDSVEALVGSLSGRMAAALKEGHIEGAAYDLLATDLLGWLLSGGLLRDATDFNCAAVNFNVRDGRATSDRLYVLTRNMIASGNATIDLAARQLDIRVQPRARKRSVQMPSSITVRGPLGEPKVSISPIAATMDTTAKILFFVPDLLLRLFGLGPDADGQVQPCTVEG